jgi:adenylyltransferase/sulfurtransferase
VEDLKEKMDGGWAPFVLDVRWEHEAAIATLPFVDLLHPHDQVPEIIDSLPKDRDVVVTCRSGGRSARACMVLAQHGFSRLFNLQGGILAWSDKIDPSIPKY